MMPSTGNTYRGTRLCSPHRCPWPFTGGPREPLLGQKPASFPPDASPNVTVATGLFANSFEGPAQQVPCRCPGDRLLLEGSAQLHPEEADSDTEV